MYRHGGQQIDTVATTVEEHLHSSPEVIFRCVFEYFHMTFYQLLMKILNLHFKSHFYDNRQFLFSLISKLKGVSVINLRHFVFLVQEKS